MQPRLYILENIGKQQPGALPRNAANRRAAMAHMHTSTIHPLFYIYATQQAATIQHVIESRKETNGKFIFYNANPESVTAW